MRRSLALVVLAGVVTGCALTSRSAPLEIRYFSPVPAAPSRTPTAPREASIAAPDGDLPRLRLGDIRPSAHLREDIARRTSPFELELYSTRRWTESPEMYVHRALSDALFEDRPIAEAVSGRAVTLQVDVLAFEEVTSPTPGGRVQLQYRLEDEEVVLDTGVITVERPAKGAGFVAVVAAIGAALEAATAQLADTVLRTMTTSKEVT